MFLVLDFADDFKFAGRFAAGKSDQIDFAVPGHLRLKPLRQGIDAFGADAVQTTGELISSLTKLAPGVQVSEHQLNGGHLKLRMHLNRDTSSVIADRDRSIDMNVHIDSCTESSKVLIDRVVEDLKDAVMQSALIGIPDVHSGPFSDRF